MRCWTIPVLCAATQMPVSSSVHQLAQMDPLSLKAVYEMATVPDHIPSGMLNGRSVVLAGKGGLSSIMNKVYDGDWLFESKCTDPDTNTTTSLNLGYLIMNDKRKALATWRLVEHASTKNELWQVGMVANFTGPISDKCRTGNGGPIWNAYPFRQIVDVWRHVPSNPPVYLGKSYFMLDKRPILWAYFVVDEPSTVSLNLRGKNPKFDG